MSDAPSGLLTMGRSGVDIYPLQSGLSLDQVETFGKFLGGSATNVAVAAARLGVDAGVITRVGHDPFGVFVAAEIERFGVHTGQVLRSGINTELPTPVTFCELFPPDNFPLYFYRNPSAPDLQIQADELDLDAISDVQIFWSTVTGLCQDPSRSAHHSAWAARRNDPGQWTVLDLDYRPMFWPDAAAAHTQIQRALPHLNAVVGNLTECSVAVTGTEEVTLTADELADAILDWGMDLAVVKQGPDGVLAATATDRVISAPVQVEVVNGLGAGDAFGGALCHGLLTGAPLNHTLDAANVAGAHVAAHLACADAMPTAAEIDAALVGR